MSLSVEIVGYKEFLKDVENTSANLKSITNAAITNSVNRIQSNVRQRAPHATGALQRTVLTQINYPDGQVSVNSKYGIYVEKGTGIYAGKGLIRPKRAKVLAFKAGGSQVFAKYIKGMRAQPFFKPGVEESVDYVQAQFIKLMDVVVRQLAGK